MTFTIVLLNSYGCLQGLLQIVDKVFYLHVPHTLVGSSALAPRCAEVVGEAFIVLYATLYAHCVAYDAGLMVPRVAHELSCIGTVGEECCHIISN